MNDNMNDTVGDVILDNGELKMMTHNGLVTVASSTFPISNISANTVTITGGFDIDEFLDQHIMNRVTIDHKVQEQELMKLKEVAPDYANEIKENLAKNVARDIVKKVTFTKKHDKDADVHHFIGRVWCFTEQELKEFIKEARNA